ncbi:hypothetical protein Y032_0146g2535 [Ancylostoma ceylanicum]|uniref:Uncharacterized protein n=1 Tax=Ancylostoma ceylanicum TaxID=53326 RepID=A0A016T1H6_9BILA|nr:hypothetical protein Y032_0146g2535 [Ancylostoma ceylanicum]
MVSQDNHTDHIRDMSEIRIHDFPEDSDELAFEMSTISNKQDDTPSIILLSRFSCLTTALRTFVIVGKAIHQSVSRVNTHANIPIVLQKLNQFSLGSNITTDDLIISETLLSAQAHRNVSVEDLRKRFPNKRIYRDSNGIVRNDSRLQNVDIPYDAEAPIYIDNHSDLADYSWWTFMSIMHIVEKSTLFA